MKDSQTSAPIPNTQPPSPRKGIGGPKTKEGKERIRLNALKLGLYAKSIEGMQAVEDVVGVEFEDIHEKMIVHLQPNDPLEETLVRRIARCTWKLMVIETMENYVLKGLAVNSAPGRSLEGLSVIERRTDVQLHRAVAALAAKRRREQENVKNKLDELPDVPTRPSTIFPPPDPITGIFPIYTPGEDPSTWRTSPISPVRPKADARRPADPKPEAQDRHPSPAGQADAASSMAASALDTPSGVSVARGAASSPRQQPPLPSAPSQPSTSQRFKNNSALKTKG